MSENIFIMFFNKEISLINMVFREVLRHAIIREKNGSKL